MPIPAAHAQRHVYHFTHIDNLAAMIGTGLLAKNHPDYPQGVRSVAAESIQARRAHKVVPAGRGGVVHDYVPLYFGSISPMLIGVIRKRNVDQRDLLYFEFPISILHDPGVVFTNRAANAEADPEFFTDPADLVHLNWGEIDSAKWGTDEVMRGPRMAEVLVHHALPLTRAARCVVFDEDARQAVTAIVNGRPFPAVTVESWERRHWFKNYPVNNNESLYVGPREILARYRDAVAEVQAARRPAHARFATTDALLQALRADFGCVPHTAELVGLKSANGVHKRTVDVHSCDVVAGLDAVPQYGGLSTADRGLVELAAYLHDIGKGPRSRWKDHGGVQLVDNNHPVNALPMVVDILTTQVAEVDAATARRLLMLVCYHDLVGDVIGRGRDESQIVEVAEDETDLDMLIALGWADAAALQEAWGAGFEWGIPALRQRCAAAIARKR